MNIYSAKVIKIDLRNFVYKPDYKTDGFYISDEFNNFYSVDRNTFENVYSRRNSYTCGRIHSPFIQVYIPDSSYYSQLLSTELMKKELNKKLLLLI